MTVAPQSCGGSNSCSEAIVLPGLESELKLLFAKMSDGRGHTFITHMFFDLSVPIEPVYSSPSTSKKTKGKAPQQGPQPPQHGSQPYTQAQISAIEARIDLLVHCPHYFLFKKFHKS